jgi:hypothetical protein
MARYLDGRIGHWQPLIATRSAVIRVFVEELP